MTTSHQTIPDWWLRPLPIGGTHDAALESEVAALAAGLPASLADLTARLKEASVSTAYDAAVNRATECIVANLADIEAAGPASRRELVRYASAHLGRTAFHRVLRRYSKDSALSVRRGVVTEAQRRGASEVAVAEGPRGTWDVSAWRAGTEPGRLTRRRQGAAARRKDLGLPALANVAALRKVLAIRSPAQLGWFLTATNGDRAPYSTFTINKRGGGSRLICAPGDQLRAVQRRILRQFLDRVPVHDAAHGFVVGRSTATNAAPHVGAEVVVKFDLESFFPTIHYHRIVGLFASLGYAAGDLVFETDDASKTIAPVLARLCVYTPNPRRWGQGYAPQGAPTSPAISNLVCRRLDARLEGLVRKWDPDGGRYTRYADDLTFSFRTPISDVGRFRWWVDQLCHQEGFRVNQSKFRVVRRSQRQQVTGVVVNDLMKVPRRQRRRFRAILHNCRQHGIDSQARGNPGFQDYLVGFASYVNMIDPDEGAALLQEVRSLLSGVPP